MDQKKLINFLIFWLVSAVVLLVASAVFRDNVVLGNDKVSASMAAVLSGFLLTVLSYVIPLAVDKADFKIKNQYALGAIYFGAYVILIWLIKRFALVSGLGISNNLFVLILALVLTLVGWQGDKILKTFWKKA